MTTMSEPLCNGGQGVVSLSIQGYTGIFKGKWLADGDEVVSKSLQAGSYDYKVWIPGIPGCSNIGESPTYSITVTEPTKVTANATIKTLPTCGPNQAPAGPDGVLEVVPTGGISVFQYKVDWDPVTGSTSYQNRTSFTPGDYERLGTGPGTYYVSVMDDHGCIDVETVVLPSGTPPNMGLSASVTSPACANLLGGINLNVTNGSNLPLIYSLLNPNDVTDTIASNGSGSFTSLNMGLYKASVTNQAGCTVQWNYTISSPNPLGLSIASAEDVGCYGESDGSISVSISGGTPSFTVKVEDLSFNLMGSKNQNSRSTHFNAILSSGDYFVYVIDGGGCISDSAYFTINEPVTVNSALPLSVSSTIQKACFIGTASGKIVAAAVGGYPVIEYGLWNGDKTILKPNWRDGFNLQFSSSSQSNQTGNFDNLSPGTYTIGVKDVNGCQRRILVSVEKFLPITVTQQSVTHVDCNGNSTGDVIVSASSGIAPLSYQLLPLGTTQSSPTFNGLPAGPYQIVAIDDLGCSSNPYSFDIVQPDPLVASITNTSNPTCNPGNGTVWYSIYGGTPNYDIILNGALSRSVSSVASNAYSQSIGQGAYTFQVKDDNGCESILDNFSITGPPSPGAPPNTNASLSASISSVQHVSCPSGTNGLIQMNVQGGWPATGGYTFVVQTVTSSVDRLGITRTVYTLFRTTNSPTINNLPAGTYRITVNDSYGCTKYVQQTIIQPDPIEPNFNGISGNCGGSGNSSQANGGVTLNSIAGGTPEYSYTLNGTFYTDYPNFFPNLNLSGINMVITDNNGCIRYYP